MAISAVGGRRAGRGSRSRSGRMPMAEINVTPFVDVMLVLLVIFMVTAPLLTAGVPIELPESRAKALAEERLQATISMNREGIIFLDERPVSIAALPGVILDMPVSSEGKLPLVTLRADKQLDYGRVMEVMGELNRAGVTSISLVTNASAAQPGDAVSDDVIAPEDVPVEDVPAADASLSGGSGEVP